MKTPFTTEQFFNVIENYNSFVFPMQFIILALGAGLMGLVISSKKSKTRVPGIFTGLLWVWIGIFYHLLFFTSINKAAYIFGSLFILQGIFILAETFFKNRLDTLTENKKQKVAGLILIFYGVVVYPVISYFSEGSLVGTISLGLPCPSTIITFGVFLIYGKNISRYLLIIPTLWSLIGISAAINFGVYQDFVMLIAAILASVFLLRKNRPK